MMRQRTIHAFTKLELISFLAVTLCILSLLIPWIITSLKKAKAQEAITTINRIFDAQEAQFSKIFQNQPGAASFITLPKTLASITKKPQSPKLDEAWNSLSINVPNPGYYAYEVRASGVGTKARFEVYAYGDLDGDGKTSMYTVRGYVDPNGHVSGKERIYQLDPLE
ncbi:MAG: hypothetical protein KDD46_04510 [Bdellovibrionales bacterium]|nr:hypothetical protein [Bdellovibrionales bacterium]